MTTGAHMYRRQGSSKPTEIGYQRSNSHDVELLRNSRKPHPRIKAQDPQNHSLTTRDRVILSIARIILGVMDQKEVTIVVSGESGKRKEGQLSSIRSTDDV